jgi:hypothetical protein
MVEKVRPSRFAKVSYLRVFARSAARWVEVDDNGNANAASGQNLQKASAAIRSLQAQVRLRQFRLLK